MAHRLAPLAYGLLDSVRLDAVFALFRSSAPFRTTLRECFLVNVLLFAGGYALQEHVAWRLATGLVEDMPDSLMWLAPAVLRVLSFLQLVTWYLPMYALCFISNLSSYRVISKCTVPLPSNSRPAGVAAVPAQSGLFAIHRAWMGLIRLLSEEVYRALLSIALLLQMKALSWLPLIGPVLHVLHLSWFYALSSFEYAWYIEGRSLAERIRMTEQHWLYFTGFGLWQTVVTTWFPNFLVSGVFAFVLPLFIVLAARTRFAATHLDQPPDHFALPIFTASKTLLSVAMRGCVRIVHYWQRGSVRAQAQAQAQAGKKLL